MRIRGFAGLPDGSEWIVDEIAAAGDDGAVAGGDDGAVAGGDDPAAGADDGALAAGDEYEAAALTLARRMLAAGAADLLRAAEAMAR